MPFHSSKGHSCHLNLIPSFHCHPIIPSSFRPKNLIHVSSHHLNVIPLAIAHGDNIQSFGCHSIHSVVIWGVEMTGDENIVEWQEWCWNDVLVIWNTFPSILSSQMSGEKYDNSWFHPYHSASSHHLCVIREFWINEKMPQMTSEWRMIFGLVWPLSLGSQLVNDSLTHYLPLYDLDTKYDFRALGLEHKTCDILAAERLRLMRFDNRLIIDSFQKAICILKW